MANQNTISGQIIHKESGLGIPNLIVHGLDVDPKTINPDQDDIYVTPSRPLQEEDFEAGLTGDDANPTRKRQGLPADRLGSVATDENGFFELTYEDDAFKIRQREARTGAPSPPTELRPDLFLVVTVPEESGVEIFKNVIYRSNWARVNAGREEQYLIKISTGKLQEFGVSIPASRLSDTDVKIAAYQHKIAADDKYNEAVQIVQKGKIAVRQQEIKKLKTEIKKILAPDVIVGTDYTTFVKEGEKVGDKIDGHINKETEKANAILAKHAEQNKGIQVTFVLNEEEKTSLGIDTANATSKPLTDDQLKSILAKMNAAGTDNLVLTSNNPILKFCLKKSDDTQCATEKLGLSKPKSPDNGQSPEPEADDVPLTPQDITKYVSKVLNELRLKNDPNQPGMTRPDARSVEDSVDNFSLKKGPAESPAFFDFRILNIAFGHIWQQLIDEEPVKLAAEAVNVAKQKGYDLSPDSMKSKNKMQANLSMALLLYSHPPKSVVANFDISYEEWNALETPYQEKLEEICEAIDKANAGLIYDPDGSLIPGFFVPTVIPPGYERVSTYVAEQYLQKLKEQGELIIDYIRSSNGRSFHKILTDLDNALKSNYAFTIFGADPSARAVNFGLLNTYRQKWEPLAYFVGDLVKSIPLSPKEERKYSLKTTFNRKRSEKEARKNNSSLQQEQNTTSRAEQEIVNKAQTKTDFNIGAEGGLGTWKITSSLGIEASKESQQNKKDFRESVLKAAQEFKEERSMEIDTEETYSSEYNESGTIVNPNDELAVTYLFYNLHKRFKVSEQLYRIMPVVLVAQDVPDPSEITVSWVILHDWIFNRWLLDDSFRPALQYIAQKNVGDDYAIRELRKNLRTQRQLVETLKKELSTTKKEADNRYNALEKQIEERIREESFERTTSWYDFWSGEKDEVIDPEAAKAREMAAKDAHAYAIENAEKMAIALQREVNSLHQLTADYNKTMRENLDMKTLVARLLSHIKNNIIYYMQKVWQMEDSHQLYMRMLNVNVPQLEFDEISCELMQIPEKDLFAEFRNKEKKETLHKAWLKAKIKQGAPKPLVEIADLGTPLGFQGNYRVFPMKRHNALTELMAMPYVDAAFGAMDPDQLSNVSLEDYARYVCCLKEKLSETDFLRLIPTLKEWLELLLADPLRNGDEIILPSNSLFIEMLTSSSTLLEDFKLQHREWDIYKVQEEVRMQALENLRYAKRILMDELEDPRIEKKIVVEGNGVGLNLDVDHG